MYKAPEIVCGSPYDGIKVDVFALGVTLFALVTGKCPFQKASRSTINYRMIITKNWKKLWTKLDNANVFSEEPSDEFKNLFEKMVAFDAKERPTVEEILNHPWFQLPTATKEEVI